MIFTKREVLGIVERLSRLDLCDSIVYTNERTAIKLKSGTIVEYIY